MSFDIGNFDFGNFGTVPPPVHAAPEVAEPVRARINPLAIIGRELAPGERGWSLRGAYALELAPAGDQLETMLIHGPSGTGKTFLLFILFETVIMLTGEPIFWVDRKGEWHGFGYPKHPLLDRGEWRYLENTFPHFLGAFCAVGVRERGRVPSSIYDAFVDAFVKFFSPDRVRVFFPPYANLTEDDLRRISRVTGYRCEFFRPSWKFLTPAAAANLFNLNISAQYMDTYERAFFEARRDAENYQEFVARLAQVAQRERRGGSSPLSAVVHLLASPECYNWFSYEGDNVLTEAYGEPGSVYVLTFVGIPQAPKNAAWVELWVESAIHAARAVGRPCTVAVDDVPWFRTLGGDIAPSLEKLVHIESRVPGVGMRKIVVVQTPRMLPPSLRPASRCYRYVFSSAPSFGFHMRRAPQYEAEVHDYMMDTVARLALRPPLNRKLPFPREAFAFE